MTSKERSSQFCERA